MFEASPQTAKLDAALAKAQGEIEPAIKDKVNPAFRSKYADLSACWAAARPALSKHGISLTQWPIHSDDGRMHLVTRLAHDGEWIKCEFSIPVSKPDAHGHGSAITYLKRFALSACLGLVADEDDDGNAASTASAPREISDSPALGRLVKLLAAEDEIGAYCLSKEDEQGFRSAFGRLNTKDKAKCRDLEQKGSLMIIDWAEYLRTAREAEDEDDARAFLAGVTDKTAKKLLWAAMDVETQAFVEKLKLKEAA